MDNNFKTNQTNNREPNQTKRRTGNGTDDRRKAGNIKSSPSKQKRIGLLIVLVIILAATSSFFAYKYQSAKSNPQAQLEKRNNTETKEVINSLSKILLLPTDKQPTVAKVEDIESLKKTNETFYKDVAKEDYLILYTDRAVIFRKSENKIINIAPIVDSSKLTPNKDS